MDIIAGWATSCSSEDEMKLILHVDLPKRRGHKAKTFSA
jgi:hypothetical protein